ncbi:cell division protein FtsQ/DivIB [Alicyclobacillus dauci]|uniref:FtsQ-type POTRA domain-containing protein n=1 Tax=Alicyclobacillus dauci TaxID=1475485 RepID=A0ABY6YZY6_9BACL|nr:FtsQ-type POTRA domain-containing protein [Alicyclobacillus dauci]WAH35531.1 FtsQ-type POTRA domain-containing protein [Alicyclobacillus dauci]
MAVTQEERARRKSRNRKIVMGFFVFIGIVVVLESPLSRVRHVDVSGNVTIQDTRIVKDSGIRSGESLWQVNGEKISSQITSMEPMVQSIQVSTNWLQGSVHIGVTERHVVAIYESSGKFYELLDDGVVYSSMEPTSGLPFPVVTGSHSNIAMGQAVSPEVTTLCKQIAQIGANALSNVSELHANGDGTVSMYLDNGFVVIADNTGLEGAINVMQPTVQYFIQKGYKPGTIDLSGPPPYRYTPFASKQQSASGIPGSGTNNSGQSSSGQKGATG